jgi:hypothetical protein
VVDDGSTDGQENIKKFKREVWLFFSCYILILDKVISAVRCFFLDLWIKFGKMREKV